MVTCVGLVVGWSPAAVVLFKALCGGLCRTPKTNTHKKTHTCMLRQRVVSSPSPPPVYVILSLLWYPGPSHTQELECPPPHAHICPPHLLWSFPLSLSPFPHEFSTSSLSSLTSSCVTQLRSISSSPICYKYRLPTQEC